MSIVLRFKDLAMMADLHIYRCVQPGSWKSLWQSPGPCFAKYTTM